MVGFGYIRESSQFPKTYYNYNVFNVVMVVLRKILNFTHLFLLNVCFFKLGFSEGIVSHASLAYFFLIYGNAP